MEPDPAATAADMDLREIMGTVLINQSMINNQIALLINYLAEGRGVEFKELQVLAEIIQSSAGNLLDVMKLSNGPTNGSHE